MSVREIDPKETTRASAFKLWCETLCIRYNSQLYRKAPCKFTWKQEEFAENLNLEFRGENPLPYRINAPAGESRKQYEN